MSATQLACFFGLDASGNQSVWTTDGTSAGTTEIPVNGGDPNNLYPDFFTPYGGMELFSATTATVTTIFGRRTAPQAAPPS